MTPIFDVDESQDVKTFYHNTAYKANRMAINVEKMKVTMRLLGLCGLLSCSWALLTCCCCCRS